MRRADGAGPLTPPPEPAPQDPAARALRARPRRGARVGIALAALAVVSIALNLRLGAASPGPLLAHLATSLGAGEDGAGAITAMPGLCFGILGLLAVPLGRRTGLTGAIVLALVATATGLLLRPLVGSLPLFLALTTLGLAGPAVGNVLVPAWVKRHGGSRITLLMTAYTAMLAIGAALGSLLAVPLAGPGPEGWRASLLVAGVIVVLPAVIWVLVLTRTGNDFPPPPPVGDLPGSLLRSPTAIALTATFGLQSMTAYVQLGWLPRIYIDAGLSPAAGGALTALLSALGLIGGIAMPSVVSRARRPGAVLLALGLITAAGYAGLLVAPAAGAVLWAVLLGVGGWTFASVIALIPGRSAHPAVTARLSGMVQPVGYFLAALGPLAAGLLRESLGDWRAVLTGLTALSIVMGAVGARAASHRLVDDELRA